MPSIASHSTKKTETWVQAAARSGGRGRQPDGAAGQFDLDWRSPPGRRRKLFARAHLPARPGLLLLVSLLFFGLTAALKSENVRPCRELSRFVLPSGKFCPNLNIISAEAPKIPADRAPREIKNTLGSPTAKALALEFPNWALPQLSARLLPEPKRSSRLVPVAAVSLLPIPLEN